MKRLRTRGFTLLDLAGSVACLLLALTVLLPALAANRSASQSAVGRGNLKQLIRAHAAYSLSNQDRWLNPFNPTTNHNGHVNAADPEWYSVRVPHRPGYVWRFDHSGYQTELYGLMWASTARAQMLAGDAYSPTQFDPRDSQLIEMFQQLSSRPDFSADYIWAGSYVYSPTMWFSSTRYASISRHIPTPPNQVGGTRSVRYNTTADATYPSQKAVLFVRADFDQTTRTAADGQPVQLPPQWNNFAAIPYAAFADGSVDDVSIRKQRRGIDAGAAWLVPTSPSWNLPLSILENYSAEGAGWENGQNNSSAWAAHFWGTRNGIAGRDVLAR